MKKAVYTLVTFIYLVYSLCGIYESDLDSSGYALKTDIRMCCNVAGDGDAPMRGFLSLILKFT